MAVHIFKENTHKLDESSINDSFALYLHNFAATRTVHSAANSIKDQPLMSYDEFKEYYILTILGRSSEFTENIARDFQYLSFGNHSQLMA